MNSKEESTLLEKKSFSKRKMCCRIATVIILFIIIIVLVVVGISISTPTATATPTPTATALPTVADNTVKRCFQNKTSPPCECAHEEKIDDISDLPDGAKIEGPVSLGIVVDTTISMGREIRYVKQGASELLRQNEKYKVFDEYLITDFNDPYVSDVKHTRDAAEGLKLIHNIPRVSSVQSGFDCPEYSLTAILKTARKAELGSFIFVFTDAPAKDFKLEEDVLKVINKKMITVNIITTHSFCEKYTFATKMDVLNNPVYKRITEAQGGRILYVRETEILDLQCALGKTCCTNFQLLMLN